MSCEWSRARAMLGRRQDTAVVLSSDSSLSNNENEAFLPKTMHGEEKEQSSPSRFNRERSLWILLTLFSSVLIVLCLLVLAKGDKSAIYGSGFVTDLQIAKSAIHLKEIDFHGGITVNASGDFELLLIRPRRGLWGNPREQWTLHGIGWWETTSLLILWKCHLFEAQCPSRTENIS
ncbi:hypothetical protein K431DRAFT_295832 [Polychaeton citri CBS 116435]|uniref:Uncharacterized protein n=1 Tax=Polychaeton citri CBS 116435 TaxID=1314669 RepID=A0A9P4Q513_9PEZI|nr:hypothetical protein K431DRAFT_295832 [Polychaeton citri CBS 116435]